MTGLRHHAQLLKVVFEGLPRAALIRGPGSTLPLREDQREGLLEGAGSSITRLEEDSRSLNLGSRNDAHREGTDYKRDGRGTN